MKTITIILFLIFSFLNANSQAFSLSDTTKAFNISDTTKCCFFNKDSGAYCCPILLRHKDTISLSEYDFNNYSGFTTYYFMGSNKLTIKNGKGEFIKSEKELYNDYNSIIIHVATINILYLKLYYSNAKNIKHKEGKYNGEDFVGPYKEYFKDETLKKEGSYDYDNYKKKGKWIYYKKNGKVKRVKQY